MGANTKIQWAHHTFNPWRGCVKVAAGCVNCYAESQSKRNPKTLGVWGPNGTRVVASEAMWRQPLKWDKAAACCCRAELSDYAHESGCPQIDRRRVFCGSLCDVFEDWRLPVVNSRGEQLFVHADGTMDCAQHGKQANLADVRARLFSLIDQTLNLDWLLLTKRPENVRRMWPVEYSDDAGDCDDDDERRFFAQGDIRKRKSNVWLGTSISCQEDADRNIPELLKCRDLAAKLFLSIEPLVGPVMLHHWIDGNGKFHNSQGVDVDWVIVGGESGPNARPSNIGRMRSIVRQCKDAGVPCFVKQLGSRPIDYLVTSVGQDSYGNIDDDGRWEEIVLRDKKGGDPSEWPEDVRVREVP